MNMGMPTPEKSTPVGAIIGIIVIVLILACGAYYFFTQLPTTEVPVAPEATETPAMATDATVSAISTQGTSTNISDIEKDLNATNMSTVDVGLSDINL